MCTVIVCHLQWYYTILSFVCDSYKIFFLWESALSRVYRNRCRLRIECRETLPLYNSVPFLFRHVCKWQSVWQNFCVLKSYRNTYLWKFVEVIYELIHRGLLSKTIVLWDRRTTLIGFWSKNSVVWLVYRVDLDFLPVNFVIFGLIIFIVVRPVA